MIGKGTQPETTGIASTYEIGLPWPFNRRPGTGLGKAAQREIIRKTPKKAKALSKYISKSYKKELRALEYSAKKLHNGMAAFRGRQTLKVATSIALGVGVPGFMGVGLYKKLGKGSPGGPDDGS